MDRNWVEGAGTAEIVSRFESMEVQVKEKEQQNQKLREALEEIVDLFEEGAMKIHMVREAQQALEEGNNNE
jgi:hypothetical protein